MTIEIPRGIYALLGVLLVVVAAVVPLSLLWRRRAATPKPVGAPARSEADETEAIIEAFDAEVKRTHDAISEDPDQRVKDLAAKVSR